MFYEIILLFLFFVFVVLGIIFLFILLKIKIKEKKNLKIDIEKLTKEEMVMKEKLSEIEGKINEYFLFYEIAKKLASILNKRDLFNVFIDEIRLFSFVKDIKISNTQESGYFSFPISEDTNDILNFKIDDKHFDYIINFATLLKLCVERIKLYNRFEELSIIDGLTGIYNRRYFLKRYSEEFERAKKFKLKLSLLIVDIDDFKKINDNFGHIAGDFVLKDVAKRLKGNIRSIDLVCRFGGEEFIVVLPETDKISAITAAERLSLAISLKPFKIFDDIVNITVSIGVGCYPENTLYQDVFIELVDKALYRAKLSGKNRIGWF